MSLFDIVNPVEKAKAALAEAQKAKADEFARQAKEAMDKAMAAVKSSNDQKAAEEAAKKAATVARWKQQEETLEEALEHVGISGVDVQIDEAGFARLVGTVNSAADRDTAVAMVEQIQVSGLDVQLEVVPPPEVQSEAPALDLEQPTKYKVKAGESWWGIAHRVYGDGQLWSSLKAFNKNPKMIHPGTEILLPPKNKLSK